MPQSDTQRIEEMDELLSSPPGGCLRSGSVIVTLFVFLLFGLAFLIRYPDKIGSVGTVTTSKPPAILNAPTTGELISLPKKDGETVRRGETIALFKNATDTSALVMAYEIAQRIKRGMNAANPIVDIPADTSLLLGELREPYQSLVQNWKEYENLLGTRIYEKRSSNAANNLAMLDKSEQTARKQLEFTENEFANTEKSYKADRTLYEKGAMSKMEFLKAENEYLNAQKNLEAAREKINTVRMQSENALKAKMDLDFEYDDRIRSLKENIYAGIAAIEDFKNTLALRYSVTAPVDGTLYFITQVESNRHFQAGKPLFYILPAHEPLIFSGNISSAGLGKLKNGNRVLIELPDYPGEEFGFLEGKVSHVSSLPYDSLYRIEVQLPQSLRTDIGREIPFKPELSATAQVFTKEYSLADRFFRLLTGRRN